MRLFHNIFYRKFKSLPISYFKRGKELINYSNFTESGSFTASLHDLSLFYSPENVISSTKPSVNYIIDDFNDKTKSNLVLKDLNYNSPIKEDGIIFNTIGDLKNEIIQFYKINQSSNLTISDLFYLKHDLTFNNKNLSILDKNELRFDYSFNTETLSILDKNELRFDYSVNNNTLSSLDKKELIFDTSKINKNLSSIDTFQPLIDDIQNNINLNSINLYENIFDASNNNFTLNSIDRYNFLTDNLNIQSNINNIELYISDFNSESNTTSELNSSILEIANIDTTIITSNLSSTNLFTTDIDIGTISSNLYQIENFNNEIDTSKITNSLNNIDKFNSNINTSNYIHNLNNLLYDLYSFDTFNSSQNINKISKDLIIIDTFNYKNTINNTVYDLQKINTSNYTHNLNNTEKILQNIDNINYINNLNQLDYYKNLNENTLENLNFNSVLNLINTNERIDYYDNLSKLDYVNDIISSVNYFSEKLNNLDLFQLEKERLSHSFSFNNLRYELDKLYTNNKDSIQSLTYEFTGEIFDYFSTFNSLTYNRGFTNTFFNYSINNLDYNKNINQNIFNLSTNKLSYDRLFYKTSHTVSNRITSLFKNEDFVGIINDKLSTLNLDSILESLTEKKSISQLRHEYDSDKTNNEDSLNDVNLYKFDLHDSVTGSKTSFKPYDSSSNLTFNSSSLVHYVKQINEVFYLSASVMTSSRIDYGEDVELIIMGKGSTTTYKDNLDYNLPYRASYAVKNWPNHQYNDTTYWYLPIIINASDDIRSSRHYWITASFENGSDIFTDQYGFPIDI